MYFKKKHIIFSLFAVILSISGSGKVWESLNPATVSLLTSQKVFTAEDDVTLRFNVKPSLENVLLLNSSFGQTIITSETEVFEIPDFIELSSP